MDLGGSAKQQWYVMKITELGRPVYFLQSVESGVDAIGVELGINEERSAIT